MESKLECNVVKDLLPLYIDEVISEDTKAEVTKHLKSCKQCHQIYEDMNQNLGNVKWNEVDSQKDFIKLAKHKYILNFLNIIGGLAIIICFIVNLCINHSLTWFPIVATSILYAGAIGNVVVNAKKNKAICGMFVLSVGLIVLLAVIQGATYYLMGSGVLWVWKFGIPIAALWLIIAWIPVLLYKFCKWNIYFSIAAFMLLCLLGNYITRLITGDITSWNEFISVSNFIESGLGFSLGAVLFTILGRFKQWKQ